MIKSIKATFGFVVLALALAYQTITGKGSIEMP